MITELKETRPMNRQSKLIGAAIACAFAVAFHTPASALTQKECSAKYEAAKKANTLKGMKWNDFRKAECGTDAKAAAEPAKKTETKAAAKTKATNAVFPKAISTKYSKESPGKARLHTCTDQYNANKTNNANGGLKWIEKGGGYWSECNKKLKS
jgi:aspartyl-tRNA synthetase